MIRLLSLLFVFILFVPIAFADSNGAIEKYGQLPAYRNFAISPNGEHISFIRRGEKNDEFIVFNVAQDQMIAGAHITKFKARSIRFLTDEHVILRGSDTTRTFGYFGKRESSGSLVYNLKSKKFVVLLGSSEFPMGKSQTMVRNVVQESFFMEIFK